MLALILFALGAWLIHLSNGTFRYGDGWVASSIGALVVLLAVGGVLAPRSKAAENALAAAPDGPVDATLRAAVSDRLIWQMGHLNTGLAFGVVYVMTAKPSLNGSIFALVIAATAGFTVGTIGAGRRSDVVEMSAV